MAYRRFVAAALAILGLATATGAQAAPCTLKDLHWMAGAWRNSAAGGQGEERWVIGPDDRLMMSAWFLHPGAEGGLIEAGTVRAADGGLTFRLRHFTGDLAKAREEKEAPMTFTVARCDAHTVVFDGQGPQAGEHMTYVRGGKRLTFIGDFIHGGQPVKATVEFKLNR